MLRIIDPVDTKQELLEIPESQYCRIGDKIYTQTPYSNCILELKVIKNNDLWYSPMNEIVGRLIEDVK